MKYILTIGLIIITSAVVKGQFKSVDVPSDYTLLAETYGNLDDDIAKERVVIYDTKRLTEFGTEREVWILKRKNNHWKIIYKAVGGVLPSEHGGMMGDPFTNLSIERKCIVISHYGGSGNNKWKYIHRFRNQNNNWELIGATIQYEINGRLWTIIDYNLSTGKIIYREESMLTVEKIFMKKLTSLPKLNGFYPDNNKITIGKGIELYY